MAPISCGLQRHLGVPADLDVFDYFNDTIAPVNDKDMARDQHHC
jgi:hypothetical protein